MTNTTLCPCGSNNTYIKCCGIAHKNIDLVKTAQQLMRSRYSAFTLADGEYLHKSHHSTTQPNSKFERNEIVKWAKSVIWIKLDVLNTVDGMENDNYGIVEFKAFYIENGRTGVIHEKSTFEKENGHWVYKEAL
ncbi:MAG: SEC-C domain-containing protein [Ichthyobacteriaceae bacterium]|nr:SEC-C domain-containing protein [Ichthyobacteriaceae bacterium]